MCLQNTITYCEICAGDQIQYCGTVQISSYLAKLLNSLVHSEQEVLVLFLLLFLLSKIIFTEKTAEVL